jgi:enoyl-CoA hydratase
VCWTDERPRCAVRAPLHAGLRIEAACFNRLGDQPEIVEGRRRFEERNHTDRRRDGQPLTSAIARPSASE